MSKRRWTLVFVPHGSEPSRIVEVSYTVLRAAAVALGILLVLGAVAGYATIAHTTDLSRAARLQQENASLARELGELHGKLVSLADTISRISQRDSHIRVLANLEPIDPQVQEAGIGGPGSSELSLTGLTGIARRSAEVRVDLGALIRRANLLASSFKEAADSLSLHTARLAATPSIMPTQGWLSSAFSAMREHPILHLARPHEGIDISAPMGSPIEAPAAGIVIDTGWETGYGNTVTINHGFGIVTKFAHASKILVKKGQRVSRGERIALVGNTGLATGPHLHYEVHVDGRPVDPLKYVLPEGVVTD
jgi:murein DD-endopeptidase MepM/ murein hydrolase activator NlpD